MSLALSDSITVSAHVYDYKYLGALVSIDHSCQCHLNTFSCYPVGVYIFTSVGMNESTRPVTLPDK